MNRPVRTLMAGSSAALLLGVLTPVYAAPQAPEEQAFRGKTELTDATLGDQRGRYISANQILYFGVEMYTEWRTAAGDVYGASLNIGIDRNGARPTAVVTSNVQASTSGNGKGAANLSAGKITSGGLSQVQGVSQVVQVTGNGNGVANAMGVDVTTQRPVMAGAPSAQSGGNKSVVDGVNGASARTFINPNGAGVTVIVPGQGVASQTVTSLVGTQQNAQVYGDLNHVRNQLNMVIQVEGGSGAVNAARMNGVLQSTRGL